jgi:hypothetical protein
MVYGVVQEPISLLWVLLKLLSEIIVSFSTVRLKKLES